ncbi:MAG TPA: hypothetical protein VN132_14845 [Bdellovibrio sp.]|nr:hypothetical protein [Bdellovibrio sp.]
MINPFHLFFVIIFGVCIAAGSDAFSQSRVTISPECLSDRMNVDLRISLNQLLNWNESIAMSTLRNFYPGLSQKDLAQVQISIEDFGPQKKYRGFYSHDSDKNRGVIRLDCERGSIMYWPALFAHEVAHHLNENKNLSSWMDEMLAQLVEAQASPFFSYPRFDFIKSSAIVPSFFSPEKPFSSSAMYAANMLFGFYISENFRGYRLFQTLTHDVNTLNDFAQRLRDYTVDQSQFDWIRDHLSAEDLIRFFALALNINLPTRNGGTLYVVPGWSGFAKGALISQKGNYFIEPGGSLRLSSDLAQQISESQNLTVYRILKNQKDFKIQKVADPVDGDWAENYVLLVNTSLTEYLEVDI